MSGAEAPARRAGHAGRAPGPGLAGRLLAGYRRTGADPPSWDPGAGHGVPMEGYYWRIVDEPRGRVVVALCGACHTRSRRWALVGLAAHPGTGAAHAVVDGHELDPRTLGVRAAASPRGTPAALHGSARHIAVSLGEGWSLDASITRPVRAPRALGAAHLLPRLPQYWHPVVVGGDVSGSAVVAGEAVFFDGARAYVEKNWGHGFAGEWWWGHAELAGADASVAFAGGPVAAGLPASALVLRLGRDVVTFSPPLARVGVRIVGDAWEVRARRPGWEVRLEARTSMAPPHVLEVPDVVAGVAEPRSRQFLAAALTATVLRRGRHVLTARTALAGLERGLPSRTRAPAARRSGRRARP